jgi:AraC family transcriptional activator of mtrCDE
MDVPLSSPVPKRDAQRSILCVRRNVWPPNKSWRGPIAKNARTPATAIGPASPADVVITPLPGTLDGAVDRLALCELHSDVPFDDDGTASITLHCVLSGKVRAVVDGQPAQTLTKGCAMLLPTGKPLRLVAERSRGARARAPAPVRVLIGNVSLTAAVALGLGDGLRRPLLHDLSPAPGADALLATLQAELDQPGTGTVLIASALMKLFLVQAARKLAQGEAHSDPRVARVIGAVLTDPGAAHSITSLAGLIGMSRATFIRHFMRATGMNPMQFVAKARLDHAAELLRSTSLPVKSVAARIGYLNRSHFSRAFRRAHGVDPSQFRTAQTSETPSETVEEAETTPFPGARSDQ